MADVYEESIGLHKKHQGTIAINVTVPLKNKHDLSIAYTPGVARPSELIVKNKDLSFDLTWRGNAVAVVSDGSAVLGLGNIGAEAALPVMEGKALLLKHFANINGVPLVINTQDTQEIIKFIKQIVPSFVGVNLEDISAPRCFEIEESLQDIGIPVFHDDQHGTAIVVSAALRNAAKVVGKSYKDLNVVVVGAGAAGIAITRVLLGLHCRGAVCTINPGREAVNDVIIIDSKGVIYKNREGLNTYKQGLSSVSNKHQKKEGLKTVIQGADVVIGVSGPNSITSEMVKSMRENPIVFALANPVPEIMPEVALQAGAAVVATGRSDFPNQINNVLAFPGVFRAVVKGRLSKITEDMLEKASIELANLVKDPSYDNIIPDAFSPNLSEYIADAILK